MFYGRHGDDLLLGSFMRGCFHSSSLDLPTGYVILSVVRSDRLVLQEALATNRQTLGKPSLTSHYRRSFQLLVNTWYTFAEVHGSPHIAESLRSAINIRELDVETVLIREAMVSSRHPSGKIGIVNSNIVGTVLYATKRHACNLIFPKTVPRYCHHPYFYYCCFHFG